MRTYQPKHLRNYSVFLAITEGTTFAVTADKFNITAARADQVFQGVIIKIEKDTELRLHKTPPQSTADAVRANAEEWIKQSKISYTIRTGETLP